MLCAICGGGGGSQLPKIETIFSFWKKNIRRRHFKRMKKILMKSLFLKKTFAYNIKPKVKKKAGMQSSSNFNWRRRRRYSRGEDFFFWLAKSHTYSKQATLIIMWHPAINSLTVVFSVEKKQEHFDDDEQDPSKWMYSGKKTNKDDTDYFFCFVFQTTMIKKICREAIYIAKSV